MTVLWLYDCMTVWCTVYGVWQVAADSRTIRFEGTLGYLLPLPPPFPAPTCALRALNATRMYVHLSRACIGILVYTRIRTRCRHSPQSLAFFRSLCLGASFVTDRWESLCSTGTPPLLIVCVRARAWVSVCGSALACDRERDRRAALF